MSTHAGRGRRAWPRRFLSLCLLGAASLPAQVPGGSLPGLPGLDTRSEGARSEATRALAAQHGSPPAPSATPAPGRAPGGLGGLDVRASAPDLGRAVWQDWGELLGPTEVEAVRAVLRTTRQTTGRDLRVLLVPATPGVTSAQLAERIRQAQGVGRPRNGAGAGGDQGVVLVIGTHWDGARWVGEAGTSVDGRAAPQTDRAMTQALNAAWGEARYGDGVLAALGVLDAHVGRPPLGVRVVAVLGIGLLGLAGAGWVLARATLGRARRRAGPGGVDKTVGLRLPSV